MPTRYFSPPKGPHRVPFDGSFRVSKTATAPEQALTKAESAAELERLVDEMEKRQRRLIAADRYSVLFVFQAMDAAGKDGTIRSVTRGLNPAGVNVTSFKAPTHLELERDFLWRCVTELPMRGQIGIWNRSHYEEVLTVRVHPEFLGAQRVPMPKDLSRLWRERCRSIRDHVQHWARNGCVVVKFWLHVSREEQAKRLMERIDDPDSNWKFNPRDIAEREHWKAYMEAYEEALGATSRPWAPWYAIPADDKSFMRREVARIVRVTLEGLKLKFPKVSEERLAEMQRLRTLLLEE